MLTQIQIRNYRALRDVEVPLHPLTVLIGQNDSGKSSFLNAISMIAPTAGSFDPVSGRSRSFGDHDRYRHDKNADIEILGIVDRSETIRNGTSGNQLFSEKIQPAVSYLLRVAGVPMESEGYDDQAGARQLDPDGSGVPGLLDYLLRRDRRRFTEYVEVVKRHVPGLQDLEIATPHPAKRRLDLILEQGFRIPAAEASSGVRLMLFFIALTYHPSPPKLILLEEPENGVHPKRLADVVKLLKEITRGEHGGQPAQVILTTHSPYLLDSIKIPEDQVLVFRRLNGGSRIAQQVDAERLKLFLDEFMLGEVWYNQGEEGLVSK
jgi:predicted ATPase